MPACRIRCKYVHYNLFSRVEWELIEITFKMNGLTLDPHIFMGCSWCTKKLFGRRRTNFTCKFGCTSYFSGCECRSWQQLRPSAYTVGALKIYLDAGAQISLASSGAPTISVGVRQQLRPSAQVCLNRIYILSIFFNKSRFNTKMCIDFYIEWAEIRWICLWYTAKGASWRGLVVHGQDFCAQLKIVTIDFAIF